MRPRPGSAATWTFLAVLLAGALLIAAPPASAVTVTLGRPSLSTTATKSVCSPMLGCARYALAQTVPATAGARVSAPADGTITSWRMVGDDTGTAAEHLRVFRPAGGGQFTGAGISAAAADVTGAPNSTSLPIRIGEYIGIDLEPGASGSAGIYQSPGSGTIAYWLGLDEGTTAAPLGTFTGELMLNATLELARPVVTKLSPASGPIAGGQVVAITGDHLANATEVKFGATPAISFSKVSNTQINAVTPPGSAGTVDTTVATMAGTSAPSTGGKYTFAAPGGGGGGTGAATTPAKASFSGSKSSITVDRKRRFKFSFKATSTLTGNALFKSLKRIRVSRRKLVSLAKQSFTVPASGKVTLEITLSKKNFRILELNRKIRTGVTVTVKNPAGLTSKASKSITLKAPKRR